MAMTMVHQQWNANHIVHSRFQYASPTSSIQEPQSPPIPDKNNVELNRDMLIQVLEHFSTLIPLYFDNQPVRLVIHGGACMLLHPQLFPLTQSPPMSQSLFVGDDGLPIPIPAKRTATRDVDYINRSFAAEWKKAGIMDATERLRKCIRVTARQFGLGADWMNSDADIALPMAKDPQTGAVYDPIYTDSLRPNNVHLHTIFTSRNQQLTLISVTPFWAVALKLVRYSKWDPGDICALLRNGTIMSKVIWTSEILEGWLHKECWPMGYASYDIAKVMEMRKRIQHAVTMVNAWNKSDPLPAPPPSSHIPTLSSSSSSLPTPPTSSTSDRFAPEAWSMGGQGTAPAPPPNGAWLTSPPPPLPIVNPSSPPVGSWNLNPALNLSGPVIPGQPLTGHWSAPPSLGHSVARESSWIGGWAIPVQATAGIQPQTTGSTHINALASRPPRLEANGGGGGSGGGSSGLGLIYGREASWDQRRAADSSSTTAVVGINETHSQSHSQPSQLRRPRHWDNGPQTQSVAEDNWRRSLIRDSPPDLSILQSSQSAPVVPTFDEADTSLSNSRRSKIKSKSADDAITTTPSSIRASLSMGTLGGGTGGGDSFGLPPGFVIEGDYEKTSQWEWYGLSEEEKQRVIKERNIKKIGSEPEPVIPSEEMMLKGPPQQAQPHLAYNGDHGGYGRYDGVEAEEREWERHRESMSMEYQHREIMERHRESIIMEQRHRHSVSGISEAPAWHPEIVERERHRENIMSYNGIVQGDSGEGLEGQAWHPESAERAARAREKQRSRLVMSASTSAMSPSTIPHGGPLRPAVTAGDDDDIWRPVHARGVAADSLRHSQSLGVI